jgi:alanine racemase
MGLADYLAKPFLFLLIVCMDHDIRWLELDKQAFFHNIACIRSIAWPQTIAFVVKSNAYGHGLREMVQLAGQSNAISYFCTASTYEALQVADIGTDKKICVLSYLDHHVEACIKRGIELVVYDHTSCRLIERTAQQCGVTARVHLKIDTGLSRLGVQLHETPAIIKKIVHAAYVELAGVFTQLSDTGGVDVASAQEQMSQFDAAVEQIRDVYKQPFLTHVYASSGITLSARYDMVRVGANIYGLVKSAVQRNRIQQHVPGQMVQPILTWKARIIHVKHIAAGSYVGYNRNIQVHRDTIIAILPVGYADGYPRFLANTDAHVIIHGQPAPLLGVVSMNVMIVDVTDIDHTAIGDVATLVGNNAYNCIDRLAQKYGTMSLELLTKIEPSLTRYIV